MAVWAFPQATCLPVNGTGGADESTACERSDLYCPRCGELLPDGAVYCVRCGEKLGGRDGWVSGKLVFAVCTAALLLIAAAVGVFVLVAGGGEDEAASGGAPPPGRTPVIDQPVRTPTRPSQRTAAASPSPTSSVQPSPPPSPTSTVAPAPSATTAALSPTQAPLPDLVPIGLGIGVSDPADCRERTNLGLIIAVANRGSGSAGAFAVSVNGVPYPFPQGLSAGEERRQWFAAPGAVGGQATLVADNASAVAESNEANNTIAVFVPVPTPIAACTPTPGGSR